MPSARCGSSAAGTGPTAMPCMGWHQSKGKQEPWGPRQWQPLNASLALRLTLAQDFLVPGSC